ncbi:MAG: ferrous iron transporter B [Phycisphaeraceae bacterium]|nr:MAG: ferrous iron transporter B [Phycisphaeraceae bacterium]
MAFSKRVVLLGNPNTGKTTLFNRLCGLRAKTSNFPGTTQEARVGETRIGGAGGAGGVVVEVIDLPGVYSLELEQSEAAVCREVLAGRLMPRGERAGDPDVACVVLDAANLPRNLVVAGEVLRRRLPTVVALNMIDLARRDGVEIDSGVLSERLGCAVVPVSARSGEGVRSLQDAIASARVTNITPPGSVEGLEAWADGVYAACVRLAPGAVRHAGPGDPSAHAGDVGPVGGRAASPHGLRARTQADTTDRIDRVTMNPALGPVLLAGVMAALFWSIFSLATYPMDWIDWFFGAVVARVHENLPEGILADLLADGVLAGVGATVIFLPQIALLFFLISLLEDTGYLARAAMMMDRLLRPFGLPGHAFVPLLGSHACALPGIMAARAVPDRHDRLATILVAPFVTCSARLPVYVLLTGLLFRGEPLKASVAFVGCYALGLAAALVSAMIARRTILRGSSRPMALELPTYKLPSLRTALATTIDRSWVFLRNAGTNILAICVVLWWLGAYPKVDPPGEVAQMRERAADPALPPDEAASLAADADHAEARHARARSFAGRLGHAIQPVFAPLGFDWQLSVGVLTSFAAREVFVSTMAVVTTGREDAEEEGVMEMVREATREDGSPIFTRRVAWALLVYYVLAMQCLPTLAVTAREAGGARWAFLQLAWMCGVAYLAALGVYHLVA